jgi:hypothetical protein
MWSNESADEIESPEMSETFRAYGFEIGEIVYEFLPDFGPEDLSLSLFRSTYATPYSLRVDLRGYPERWWIAVTSIKQVFIRIDSADASTPLDFYDHPEWFVEGYLVNPEGETNCKKVPIRMYIHTNQSYFDMALIQRIPMYPILSD